MFLLAAALLGSRGIAGHQEVGDKAFAATKCTYSSTVQQEYPVRPRFLANYHVFMAGEQRVEDCPGIYNLKATGASFNETWHAASCGFPTKHAGVCCYYGLPEKDPMYRFDVITSFVPAASGTACPDESYAALHKFNLAKQGAGTPVPGGRGCCFGVDPIGQ